MHKKPSLLQAGKNLKMSLSNVPIIPMTLYPTMNSIAEVVALADSKIPVVHRNEMFSILMTFQNTLLQQIKEK